MPRRPAGPPPEPRAALSNAGGEVQLRGHDAYVIPLRRAMEAATAEARGLEIQYFHSYPARMHPELARVALAEFAPGPSPTLLDPFCGGGTTIVEGMRAGWRTLGSDLNPLALDLARVRSRRVNAKARARFVETVEAVADASEERVRTRVDIRADLPKEEREWYEVHVLKELAGLLAEIQRVADEEDRRALQMVFSSLVVKFSRQKADTSSQRIDKRIRKGLPTEFFVRKSEELVRAWAELDEACPEKTRRPRLVASDARKLGHTLSGDFRADLILTSPPYGGTYDYVQHHARRFAWLGYKSAAFERGEIGSRRELTRAAAGDAARRWDAQLGEVLDSLHDRLRPGRIALLLLGDAQVGGRRVEADRQIEALAPKHGFEFGAAASQSRVDYAGGTDRREHLLALLRS